jgi:ABC-2 type transport system ATP-binding protein
MPTPVLEVSDVHKRFGSVEALRGASLAVEPGDLYGLLGPNGAGKTTLLTILSALATPTSGTVKLFGKPLDRDDLSMRPLIGIATQELALYGELTARENLEFFGRLYKLHGPKLKARVDEVLELTALRDKADVRAGTFSGGMKRRLNLGLAVMHGPKILYLDEPTAGVDPQSRNHIFERVRELNRGGLTVVYTSHYMEEVQALCPRIAVLDHGRVIACDTRENLLRRLDGTLTVRVAGNAGTIAERVRRLPGVTVQSINGEELRLGARDVSALTVQVVALLREMDVALTGLEAREPTLEQVFLDLTDTKLRD